MKIFISIFFTSSLLFFGSSQKDKSLPEEIAHYYGIQQFEKAKSIEFTFHVTKKGKHIKRKWKWSPKSNQVVFLNDAKSSTFIHNNAIGEVQESLDKKFVNDCYWLLFPYYLVWDKDNYDFRILENVKSPINNVCSTKLIINYISKEGSSPNDTYEFYLNKRHEILEWVYRKGGSKIPTKTTTWEQTKSFNDIKISTFHKGKEGTFKVWFNNIDIEY
ncbi:MAG: hypothetical protein COB12_12750 [Flavobacterium sp.]|nr:MAG: hypothetical protein COB12_12750 [Flavobacterium sp.]